MLPLGLLVLTAVVFISAASTGWRLLFQLAWLLVAILIFSFIWSRVAFFRLRIRQDYDDTRLQVGDTLRERITIDNSSFLPKLWIEIRIEGNFPNKDAGHVLSLSARSEKRWLRRTPCTTRGKYTLGPIVATVSDPFGLFRRSHTLGKMRDVLVYPQVEELTDFALPAQELPGGNVTLQRSYQSTPNVTSIRDYVTGDSLNRVSWKATAHYQKLMVKEFDLDPVADVWVVLDLNSVLHATHATPERTVPPDGERFYLNSTLEYSVTAAATVASHLLERGRSVGLIMWSGSRQILPPDKGVRQLWKVLEALAVARVERTPPLRELLVSQQSLFTGTESLLVITPDMSDEWRAGIELMPGDRTKVSAIYIDALSFDTRLPYSRIYEAGGRGKVYSFVLRNGDTISEVLNRATGTAVKSSSAYITGGTYEGAFRES